MDWIKDNKFLAGYVAVFVVVGALLAYLLVSAKSDYEATLVDHEQTSKKVGMLSGKPLFPDAESLSLAKEDTKKFKAAVDGLHESMLAYNRPLDSTMTGGGFQKKLTERVVALKKRSVLENVQIGDDFSLGLQKYTAELPSEQAVPELNFHLDALDYLANALFDSEIDSIEVFERVPLAIEGGGTEAEPDRQGSSQDDGKDKQEAAANYVRSYPVRICFKGRPETLEDFINGYSNAPKEEFFFNTRYLTIKNETDEGPEKGREFEDEIRIDEGVASEEGDDPAVVIDTPETAGGVVDSRVVLGNEKIEVCLLIEAIRIEPLPKELAESN